MKDDGGMMKILMLAGGAAVAYWYCTNYGPSGAVFNTAGQQIALTWWNTWFSTVTPAATTTVVPVTTGQTAAATTNTTATTSTATSTATAPTGTPALTVQTSNDPAGTSVQNASSQILALSGATNTTMLTLDQWNYYYNQIYTPVTPTQMTALVAASPVGDQPVTIATYIAAIQQAGINSGLSGVGDYSVLPAMMSFRRGTTGARMRGMKDYKGVTTIQ